MRNVTGSSQNFRYEGCTKYTNECNGSTFHTILTFETWIFVCNLQIHCVHEEPA